MNDKKLTNQMLIAPCGINCRLCHANVRDKNHCPGCRGDDTMKMKSCLACKIKNCEKLATEKYQFCFECDEFPCVRIKHLDKRYRSRYGTRVIENLGVIQEVGVNAFVIFDQNRWTCPACGAILCMHKPDCLTCGHVWNDKN